MSAVVGVRDDATKGNIAKSCSRKSNLLGCKLSSIREEMRDFCDSMDRFVDENKIVFKNGEVERFWSQKTTDANSQTDSVDERESRETEDTGPASEEDKLRWWSTKERRLKVREIVKKREDEAKEDEARAEDITANENLDRSPSNDQERRTDDFQNVYDLMTLKTCPDVFPESTEPTYVAKNASNLECEQPARAQEKSYGVFDSLFAELRNRDSVRRKSNVSNELIAPEETLDSQTSAVDTERKCVFRRSDATTLTDADSDEPPVNHNSVAEADENVDAKTDTLEDKLNSLSLESPKEKRNIDESDDDSFTTARSLPEDTQFVGSSQESPETLRLLATENNDKIIGVIKNESIDKPVDDGCEEIVSDEERDGAIHEDQANDKAKRSDRSSERGSTSGSAEVSNSQVELLVRTMNRLSLERTSQPSKLTGKRTREAEDVQVGTKKSLFVEEVDPGRESRKSEDRKTRSQISERCRQHVIEEARKFVRKSSPLIDKCITTLIKDTENADEKSRYYNKYGQKSLAECLMSVFATKNDLDKIAGDSAEQNNRRRKHEGESESTTNAYPTKSMAKRTTNSEFSASLVDTGKSITIYY